MRFGLASALMDDGPLLHGGWGYYTWFDEYEVALGQPLGAFGAPIAADSSVWRRDFENGVALVNSGDETVTVELGDTYYAPEGDRHRTSTMAKRAPQ